MRTHTPFPWPTVIPRPPFTRAQWQALQSLRQQYQQDCDLFTSRELAHLRFLRWLAQSGRLAPLGHHHG